MTDFFLANWATELDVECLRDDGGSDLDTLSHPNGLLLDNNSPETIKGLLTHVWNEIIESFAYETDDEVPTEQDWKSTTYEGQSVLIQTWTSEELHAMVQVRSIGIARYV